MRAVSSSDRVTVTAVDHDGLVTVVPLAGDVQLDADEIPLQATPLRASCRLGLVRRPGRGPRSVQVDDPARCEREP